MMQPTLFDPAPVAVTTVALAPSVRVQRRVIQTPGTTVEEIGFSYRQRVNEALCVAITEAVTMRDAEHPNVDSRFVITTAVRSVLERLLEEVGGENMGIAQALVGEAMDAHGSV